MKNNGYENEKDIINYLDGKKKGEIHIIFQELLDILFPNVRSNDIIRTYKYNKYAKCDMVIDINGVKKGISIKSGFKNSVHIERINKFINYLRSLNFSKTDELLRYLYSDGSNDNTGKKRVSIDEYKISHKQDIKEINKLLNQPNIKRSLIYRFLICSNLNYNIKVDAFIYGTVYDFYWLTTNEVLEYLNSVELESSGVHVSKLFIQEMNKNLVCNPKYEWNREYIQVKWYSLLEDLMVIWSKRKS